jgi:hypothetical protein
VLHLPEDSAAIIELEPDADRGPVARS